jgi:hypothetical protein
MRIFKAFIVFIIIISKCYAYDIAKVETPPDANVSYVGDVVQNGIPLQIKQFRVQMSSSEVLGFYKQRWSDTRNYKENTPAYIEKKVDSWTVLSKMEESSSVVVQIQESTSGESFGFISVSDISRAKKISETTTKFPRLNGSELVSSTESLDNGKLATTIILVNNHSINENSEYYKMSMVNNGWVSTNKRITDNEATIYYSKQNQYCEIALVASKDGKTVIFANIVEPENEG